MTPRDPSDVFLRRLYCQTGGYAVCQITKAILADRPVAGLADPQHLFQG